MRLPENRVSGDDRTPETTEMKSFWDAKAQDNAPFYIATWRGYDRHDTDGFFLTSDEASSFVSMSGRQPTGQDRMLEIGCGIGRMTQGFAQLFGEVYAIDVSGEMIRRARVNLADYPHVHVHETTGVDLALFADEFFDFCFSYIVFQHIPEKEIVFNYIQEAGRVLKHGGVFHFQVNGLPDPDVGVPPTLLALKRSYRRYMRRPALTLKRRMLGGPTGFEASAWLGILVTPQEIERACSNAGLTIRNITGEGTRYMWITALKP